LKGRFDEIDRRQIASHPEIAAAVREKTVSFGASRWRARPRRTRTALQLRRDGIAPRTSPAAHARPAPPGQRPSGSVSGCVFGLGSGFSFVSVFRSGFRAGSFDTGSAATAAPPPPALAAEAAAAAAAGPPPRHAQAANGAARGQVAAIGGQASHDSRGAPDALAVGEVLALPPLPLQVRRADGPARGVHRPDALLHGAGKHGSLLLYSRLTSAN